MVNEVYLLKVGDVVHFWGFSVLDEHGKYSIESAYCDADIVLHNSKYIGNKTEVTCQNCLDKEKDIVKYLTNKYLKDSYKEK